MRKKLLYFDTSSINYINDCVQQNELKKLRKRFENEFDCIPMISPLNLFEIINSTDTNKKDELILTCQKFFTKNIFPSPCEILDDYLQKKTPLIDSGKFELKSDSQIAKVWKEIHSNLQKTMIVDELSMQSARKSFYKQSRVLYLAIKNNFEIKNKDEYYTLLVTLVNELYNNLVTFIAANDFIDSQKELFYKTNIFFIVLVLHFMDTPFNNVADFWEKRDIFSEKEQFEYIFNNFKMLLFRGPTVIMALMAINQTSTKYARGLLFDCLHAGYYSYCNGFVSNDSHFKDFGIFISNRLPNKIISINNLNENKREQSSE